MVRDEPLPVVEVATGGVLPKKAMSLTGQGCGVVVKPAFPVGGGDIDVFWALRTEGGCEGGDEPASSDGDLG